MKIEDVKIGTQLKVGSGIILFLILLLSFLLWWQTNTLVKDTKVMYDYTNIVKKAIGSLKYDVLELRFEYRNFLLASDESKKSMIQKSSQKVEDHFNRQLNILDQHYLGPKSDIEKIRSSFWHWIELRNSNFLIRNNQNFDKILKRLESDGDVGVARQSLLNDIQHVDDVATLESSKLMSSVSDIHKNHTVRLLILILVSFILTILMVYLLLRNIRNPLENLLIATKQFNEGQWSARCEYNSRNEFGELAASYNRLVQLIETELEVKEKANEISKIMLSIDDVNLFGELLIRSLMEKVNAQIGSLHLLNEDKSAYFRFVSIGMSVENETPVSVKDKNGILGMTLATGKMHHFKQIPENSYNTLSTMIGDIRAKEAITIPISSGSDVIAVITLFSMNAFSESNIRVIHSLMDTISARLNGILTYRKVITISAQLEEQNAALEEQKMELSSQNEVLENQKVQLDEANKLKTSFFSNMSHELRTPLNSVITLSGLLNRSLNGKLAEQESKYLEVIERNGKQLLTIINSILDYAKIESGRETITLTKFDLGSLILEIVGSMQPQAAVKGIQLNYSSRVESYETTSDYMKCFHIFQNIIANALKFTMKGEVVVELEQDGHQIKTTIRDTGIGISEEFLPYIFEPFRQSDVGDAKNLGGTGLGLSIAQKYARLLGGDIQVESTINVGSVFTISLPTNTTP